MVNDLMQEGKLITEADSTQLNTLLTLAGNEEGQAGAWARSALLANDNSDYIEPVILPNGLKYSPVIPIPDQQWVEKDNLSVYPNPANKFIIARYSLKIANPKGELLLNSQEGKMLSKFRLDTHKNFIVIPTEHLANGIYYLSLLQNGSERCTKKVCIVR